MLIHSIVSLVEETASSLACTTDVVQAQEIFDAQSEGKVTWYRHNGFNTVVVKRADHDASSAQASSMKAAADKAAAAEAVAEEQKKADALETYNVARQAAIEAGVISETEKTQSKKSSIQAAKEAAEKRSEENLAAAAPVGMGAALEK